MREKIEEAVRLLRSVTGRATGEVVNRATSSDTENRASSESSLPSRPGPSGLTDEGNVLCTGISA